MFQIGDAVKSHVQVQYNSYIGVVKKLVYKDKYPFRIEGVLYGDSYLVHCYNNDLSATRKYNRLQSKWEKFTIQQNMHLLEGQNPYHLICYFNNNIQLSLSLHCAITYHVENNDKRKISMTSNPKTRVRGIARVVGTC